MTKPLLELFRQCWLGGGVGLGEGTVEGGGFFDGGQPVGGAPGLGEPVGLVVQRPSEMDGWTLYKLRDGQVIRGFSGGPSSIAAPAGSAL